MRGFILVMLISSSVFAGEKRDPNTGISTSNQCVTPAFWCYMGKNNDQYEPVATKCYCGTPQGPLYGIVRPVPVQDPKSVGGKGHPQPPPSTSKSSKTGT